MAGPEKLDLILCWHMHQPDYRDYATGEFRLPWVYLHAIKDYTDMAWHLENHPKLRAVVNFVPILLDQLEDYSRQFESARFRDPLLNLLAREDLDKLTGPERKLILERCFHLNAPTMLSPFLPFRRLQELYERVKPEGEAQLSYLSGQFLADLITWFHLAWTGESVRRSHGLVIELITKGEQFTYDDRRALLALIGRLVRDIIPRYRALAEGGQVEISATPHYHPMAPLLLDFSAAREPEPAALLPDSPIYPGGRERIKYHIASAIESHARRFGRAPDGMWPAEGGLSNALLPLLAEHGVRWTASGEGVLAASVNKVRATHHFAHRKTYLYRPSRVTGDASKVACFFRDDRLSDLIGFEYSKWHGRDAAYNFIQSVEDIRVAAPPDERPVVSVILDGENAWEFYPYNGYYFLDELYSALERHLHIESRTFRDVLERGPAFNELPGVVAGSWVYGNFSTWIGMRDKNRAWDLLAEAKCCYDKAMAGGQLAPEDAAAAGVQLASCESSDWFWWLGDYNPAASVADFDRLFRENLANLYRLLRFPPPQALSIPLSHGAGQPESGGAMRRARDEHAQAGGRA